MQRGQVFFMTDLSLRKKNQTEIPPSADGWGYAAGTKLPQLNVNGHLIITPEHYFSFANEGLL
jgi:hypothetical protein